MRVCRSAVVAATAGFARLPDALSGTPAEARVHTERKQMTGGGSMDQQETVWVERVAAEMQAAPAPMVSAAAEEAMRKEVTVSLS
jgi:hypothetical protein